MDAQVGNLRPGSIGNQPAEPNHPAHGYEFIRGIVPRSRRDPAPIGPLIAGVGGRFQKLNEELVKAAVMVGSGRLYPSSQGKRGRFDGKRRTVIDGGTFEVRQILAFEGI